ncbi:hypothetical protein [Pantoea ananatis]|uniref:hypothetical protein n=1 Tax=Pantoea ananas TaxID=553 RepID=UPI000CF4F677|nr:hypothetical protein [Pantoea ananatis]PQK94211.1 hypothetical protein CG433_08860 [Pantoea ananatis]
MGDFIINLVMSLVTGGYMGIVVSKAVAFSNIKKEALRIVRAIDTLGPKGEFFHNTDNVNNLMLLSSELRGLNHQKAADVIIRVFNDIRKEIDVPSKDSSIRNRIYEESQTKIRTLPVNKKTLFNPVDFSL